MSGYLAGKVWRSGLSADLKPFAAALADVANDDGSNLYPSIEYMIWLTGRSERTIRGWLSDLRALKVLKLVGEVTDLSKLGRGYGAEYEMVQDKLPKRPKWAGAQTARTHANSAGVKNRKPCNPRREGLQSSVSSLLSDPSLDPSGVPVSQQDVPKTGSVYAGGGTSKPPKFKNKRHQMHVFCGDYFCVDLEKHQKFEKRIALAGQDLTEYNLPAWYAARDAELVSGEEETTDHPALWLEKQFAQGLKESVAS